MHAPSPKPEQDGDAGILDELPGELMMWVLIVSELLVFGAGLAAFMGVRISDPAGFATARAHLDPALAGVNTIVLITSGFLAARSLELRLVMKRTAARLHLIGAMALGCVFLAIKIQEYAVKIEQGISTETHPFFTFYYLLTGFHAAHVLAGIVVLGLVAWKDEPRTIETGTAFWHMVDLIWVLLFPVIYVLGQRMMTLPSVTLAWIALLGLSAATVLVTTGGTGHFSPALFGGLLLLLAFIKARIILSRYLGLWQAPAWLSGFSWVIGFFCLLLLVLYVAPGLSP